MILYVPVIDEQSAGRCDEGEEEEDEMRRLEIGLGGRECMWRAQRRILLVVVIVLLALTCRSYYVEILATLRPTPQPPDLPVNAKLLDRIDLDCDGLFAGDARALSFYDKWVYDHKMHERPIFNAANQCAAIRASFHFQSRPLSAEEAAFPLAYGLVVYKNLIQVLFMLSSFYQPQNLYCIAVDGHSAQDFKNAIKSLPTCFDNIHIIELGPISWGSYSIVDAVFSCLNYAANTSHSWKYYQYLAGVDAPLKTNLEMVRILSALNGTMNMEISRFQIGRMKRMNGTSSPLPLFKSSLSALVPRGAANVFASHELVKEFLNFVRNLKIPDEALWATMGGNIDLLPVPGGLPAIEFLELKENLRWRKDDNDSLSFNVTNTKMELSLARDSPIRYYLSRYQVWTKKNCQGKLSAGSCVFGVYDLERLNQRYELVAHKLYIDYQPAAFFCLLKEHQRRSAFPEPFNATNFTHLPQVEYARGVPLENLSYPEAIN